MNRAKSWCDHEAGSHHGISALAALFGERLQFDFQAGEPLIKLISVAGPASLKHQERNQDRAEIEVIHTPDEPLEWCCGVAGPP